MDIRTHYADLFYRESDKLSTLEQNVKDFPASAIARFSLLYHYKKNNNPEFEKFANQTSLYFNNSYWLRDQLSQTEVIESHPLPFTQEMPDNYQEPNISSEFVQENAPAETTVAETEVPEKDLEIIDEALPVAILEEFVQIENDTDSNESHVAVEDETPADHVETDFSVNPEGIVAPSIEDELSAIPEPVTDPKITDVEHSGVAPEVDEFVLPNEPENLPAEENDGINETLLESSEVDEETPALAEMAISNTDDHITDETLIQAETSEDEEVEEEIIAFEPLHTIDYFASQGIKIKEEALTNDKLGQQVKSFTAWLKSMKKLHPGKLPEQNEVIERIIQSSAEESNADAEVLTEAMAEVLIKQNKVGKAIEMYEKLSLINPSKSTYFAAKIEILKTR